MALYYFYISSNSFSSSPFILIAAKEGVFKTLLKKIYDTVACDEDKEKDKDVKDPMEDVMEEIDNAVEEGEGNFENITCGEIEWIQAIDPVRKLHMHTCTIS